MMATDIMPDTHAAPLGRRTFMVSVTSDPTWVARWRALSAANAAVSKNVVDVESM